MVRANLATVIGARSLAACAQPRVEAELRRSCGPTDGPAFEALVPDGEGYVRLFGPDWPAKGAGPFAVGAEDPAAAIAIYRCDEPAGDCETAMQGSFAIAPQNEGAFPGTVQAVFPDSGTRRIAFTARVPEDHEPPICG